MMKAYKEYKESGLDWLGEIPAGWENIPLRYLAKIQTGNTPSKNTAAFFSKEMGLPWVKPDELEEFDKIFSSKELLTKKGIEEAKIIPANSILVCCIGTIGKIGVAGCNLTTNQQINAVTFSNRVSKTFSQYLMYASSEEHKRLANGNVVEILNTSNQKSIYLPVPPLHEQTAIANFLDNKTAKIDELVAIKRRQIALLSERKQILIQNAVTKGLNPDAPMKDSGIDWIGEIPVHWEVKRVKYLLSERSERSESGEEPLLMVSQIHGLVVRADFHSKSEVAVTSVGNKIVHENDLVFNKLKAHLGIFFKSKIKYAGIVSPDYAVYVPNGIIPNSKFFEILFRHPAYIGQFIIRATGIVEGLIRLYTSDLFDIPVAVLPENEQQEIIDYCASTSNKIATAITIKQNQITKLNEYKTTLINAAVTGKIKVV